MLKAPVWSVQVQVQVQTRWKNVKARAMKGKTREEKTKGDATWLTPIIVTVASAALSAGVIGAVDTAVKVRAIDSSQKDLKTSQTDVKTSQTELKNAVAQLNEKIDRKFDTSFGSLVKEREEIKELAGNVRVMNRTVEILLERTVNVKT